MLRKLNELTKFKGVIGRKGYWLYQAVGVAIILGSNCVQGGLAMLLGPDMDSSITYTMLVLNGLSLIAALIVAYCGIVRRLHDVNLSGYYALVIFIAGLFWPVALALIVILGIVPPRHENNRFLNQK